jgi:hypothetical protein
MATKDINVKNVVVKFPKIVIIPGGRKDDRHVKKQKRPVRPPK